MICITVYLQLLLWSFVNLNENLFYIPFVCFIANMFLSTTCLRRQTTCLEVLGQGNISSHLDALTKRWIWVWDCQFRTWTGLTCAWDKVSRRQVDTQRRSSETVGQAQAREWACLPGTNQLESVLLTQKGHWVQQGVLRARLAGESEREKGGSAQCTYEKLEAGCWPWSVTGGFWARAGICRGLVLVLCLCCNLDAKRGIKFIGWSRHRAGHANTNLGQFGQGSDFQSG